MDTHNVKIQQSYKYSTKSITALRCYILHGHFVKIVKQIHVQHSKHSKQGTNANKRRYGSYDNEKETQQHKQISRGQLMVFINRWLSKQIINSS